MLNKTDNLIDILSVKKYLQTQLILKSYLFVRIVLFAFFCCNIFVHKCKLPRHKVENVSVYIQYFPLWRTINRLFYSKLKTLQLQTILKITCLMTFKHTIPNSQHSHKTSLIQLTQSFNDCLKLNSGTVWERRNNPMGRERKISP